jgi:competence protein ComEC
MPIFALFLAGIILFYLALFFPFTAVVVFILAALLLIRSAAGRTGKPETNAFPPLFLPLLILLGFAYAFFRYSSPPDPSALSGREILVGCVTETSPRALKGGRFENEVTIRAAMDAGSGEELTALHGRGMNIISPEGLPRGMRYRVTVKTGKDMERRTPGTMRGDTLYCYLDEVRGAEPVKGTLLGTWLQDSRERLNSFLTANFAGDAAALLASLTTGERSAMSDEIKDAFNATGLVHLLSISGTHFGLFSALIFGIFRLLIGSIPYRYLQRFTMYLSPSQAAAIISLPFMLFYLALSGASFPAVRSFIMINTFLLGLLIGRKGFWLNSVLFAAFVICLWEPSAVLSISFQLSFLAVLFIGYFLGEKRERTEKQEKQEKQGLVGRFTGMCKGTVMLTLAASLGTAPLAAYYFHYFSLVSPLANLFMTPFIGFILVPCSLLSSFVFIFTGHYPFHSLVAFLTDLSLMGVKFFASIPYADIKIPAFPPAMVVLFYAGCMTYFLSGRKRYWLTLPALSILLFLTSLMYGKNTMAVTYLDVGQGDCAVVEGSGGKLLVIDTGRTGRELDAYLRYLGKRRIDALVITHADGDHAGGLGYVTKRFHVREVWDNGLITYPEPLPVNAVHRSLARGDEAGAQGLTIQVFHPYDGFSTLSEDEAVSGNNDSLVIRIAGKRSFLFTADTAEEAEEDMRHLGGWLKSDVLKVSHHGSRTSSSEEFLWEVSPRIGVISVGKDNPYGHPHEETLERLQGVRIYRTDRDGAVKITETADGLAVKTYRDFAFEHTRSAAGEWRNIMRVFSRW